MEPDPPERNRRTARWLLVDPAGWFVLQIGLLFLAGVIGRVIIWLVGDVSTSAAWAIYAVLLIGFAVVIYKIRRRYLTEHPEDDQSIGGIR
jgi:F0F1-type ATP synthase assembly protein I